ncbi:hypothetical protein GH714_032250 [Hevea brasiliensis]|uniref:Uncharacterized protein n=1 Tax=Hevea brasiliensis TaxID=3981 RepID=A0A6A6MEV5_HEVBR|nr:hypothetical protein GH714_032250 [Hevea brasiliensis]
MFMQLDVNTKIYPIKEEEKYALLTTATLHADGTGDTGYYDQANIDGYTIAPCIGQARIHRELFISFCGLWMSLKGNPDSVTEFRLD